MFRSLPPFVVHLIFLMAGLAGAGAPVQADDAAARVLLADLDRVAASRPDLALSNLAPLDAALAGAAPSLQREALLRIRRLQRDIGEFRQASALDVRLRKLGLQFNDQQALAEAALGEIDDLIRAYRFTAAKAAHQELVARFNLASMPETHFHALMSAGRLYLLNSEYERTLAFFEAGRALAGRLHAAGDASGEALLNLAQLYNVSKDPQRALGYLDQAARRGAHALRPRMRSNLHFSRALVLINLERLDEGYAELVRSLEIARASRIHVMHAHVLGNMADLALRRERWREAEQVAREALAVSRRIHDESAELMAKANIGFALGGQGRGAEAEVFLDEVIGKFRADANLQALSAMLDEKAAMFERLGRYKDGMTVLREQQRLERRQFTVERTNAVAAMQEKFEQAEHRRRIEQLQQENRAKDAALRQRELKQLALALAALLLLVVVGGVWALYRRAGKSNGLLRELNARLEYHAVRDPLTGLYNRRSFVERMQMRSARLPFERRGFAAASSDTFMILDIDHFKRVNDSFGHGVGDAVLVEVARRLQASVRETDAVMRWGGEEFVIHSPGQGGAAALAGRILDAIGGTPIIAGAVELTVTASAGLIELPFAGLADSQLNWERAIQLADAALYRAKTTGRNRCCHIVAPAEGADAAQLAEVDPVAALAQLELHAIAGPVHTASDAPAAGVGA